MACRIFRTLSDYFPNGNSGTSRFHESGVVFGSNGGFVNSTILLP